MQRYWHLEISFTLVFYEIIINVSLFECMYHFAPPVTLVELRRAHKRHVDDFFHHHIPSG